MCIWKRGLYGSRLLMLEQGLDQFPICKAVFEEKITAKSLQHKNIISKPILPKTCWNFSSDPRFLATAKFSSFFSSQIMTSIKFPAKLSALWSKKSKSFRKEKSVAKNDNLELSSAGGIWQCFIGESRGYYLY